MDNNLKGVTIYECKRSELPENLKTKSGLEKLGLIPSEERVAVFKNGTKMYDLFDLNTAKEIVIKEINQGDKDILISSMKEVPLTLKTERGLLSMGLSPNSDVFATVKIGDNSYELFEVEKAIITDEEKHNDFKNGVKKTVSKAEFVNPAELIVRVEDGLPVYKCNWSSLPSNLKTKTGFQKVDMQPTGSVVAKAEIGGKLYDLYDLSENKPLEAENNPYRKREARMAQKSSEKKEPFKIKYFNTSVLKEDDMIKSPSDFAILDTETTGISNDDEVIQLSLVDLNGEVLYNGYFKPEKKSHWGALKVHKLTDKFLEDKPLWKDEWIKIAEILKNKKILIHNVIFDQRLIEQTCERYGIEIDFNIESSCTMVYCKEKYGYAKLETVLEKNNIVFESTALHNSLVDCFMTLKVIYPNSLVFNKQEEAQKLFDTVCENKIKNGDEKGREKGVEWLNKTYSIKDGKIKPYHSLRLCNAIINTFKGK